MPARPEDYFARADRDIEELRQLFATAGRRPTRRFDQLVAAADAGEAAAPPAADGPAPPARARATTPAPAPPRTAAGTLGGRPEPRPEGVRVASGAVSASLADQVT